MHQLLLLSLIAAATGVVYAILNIIWVLRQPDGGAELRVPYHAIYLGAQAFIRTQYSTILSFALLIYAVLWLTPKFGLFTAVGFAIGALFSMFSGIIGMSVSVRANVRTTQAARQGVAPAFRVALRAGAVTGFLVGALGLAAVASFYALLSWFNQSAQIDLQPLAGLGFGAALVSIFARLGGGIFTKAADVGADMVGKIEQGIPEDDPRNAAVIADNVGDNVGDCAGMAADVFESYAVTVVATMLVAAQMFPGDLNALLLPLGLGAVALLAGVVAIPLGTLRIGRSALRSVSWSVLLSLLLTAAGFYYLTVSVLGEVGGYSGLAIFYTTLVGLGVAMAFLLSTNYFTSAAFAPVRRIAKASRSGHATNIITGLAVGMESTVIPTLIIICAIVMSYWLAGLYGIAIATCALLAMTPVVITVDAFGPVTDNAGGIAEMSGLKAEVREVTDALDAVGNTTKSLTKAFAIGSAGLAALVLFAAFVVEFGAHAQQLSFDLQEPYTLAGLFIGGLLPFVFSGFALDAVGKAAGEIVAEVRRQFHEHPGIMLGKERPDYSRAVSLLTKSSLKGMLVPGLIPVAVPLAIAFIWQPLGPAGSAAHLMGGTLIGAIVSGFILAISMCTGGAAWDNAKKYIESGAEGGKQSTAYPAAVTGDTVGDPYKDTAGPAINPMRKVLSLMAVLLVPFLV